MRIFKIAELLKIYLSDVIDCIEDLGILIKKLPAQQYSILLNNFEKNMSTKAIKEAVMTTKGEKSKMFTFIQDSAGISGQT